MNSLSGRPVDILDLLQAQHLKGANGAPALKGTHPGQLFDGLLVQRDAQLPHGGGHADGAEEVLKGPDAGQRGLLVGAVVPRWTY